MTLARGAFGAGPPEAPPTNRGCRPNLLVILADDLGYSDLGCYGAEIETPNLDRLAQNGLRYTQFYNTARCWPSRAALLTGYYAQQVGHDSLPGQSQPLGTVPSWRQLLSERLRHVGYRCYHSGKWHLDGQPTQLGFDRSYRIEDHDRYFRPRFHFIDDQPVPGDGTDATFYVTTYIAEHAITCLRDHQRQHPHQPFFQFVAFTAPHFPLQAPAADIDRYRLRYQVGWDTIRQQRWQRIQRLLQLPTQISPLEPHIGPPYFFADALQRLGSGEVDHELPWNELTPAQQQFQATKMAIHAAMVDGMDREVGRLLQQLTEMGCRDDTLVVFLSDNGASAEIMVRGDGHDPSEPLGSAKSFLCLGPGWSRCANTPFRRHKTWVHEGGISTPCIVSWPAGIPARGELRSTPAHVIDLAPTLVRLALGSWTDRLHAPPRPGIDLIESFHRDVTLDRSPLWWYHERNAALRDRDWKLVSVQGGTWELYNLAHDRAENHDVATRFPEIANRMAHRWQAMTDEFRRHVQRGPE